MESLNKKTIAVLTDMSQPLGREVGNANEVMEAVEVLSGRGAGDLTTVALTIAAHMTVLGGAYPDFTVAYAALEQMLHSGIAIEKFKQFVEIQGGDAAFMLHPQLLPQAANHIEVKAEQNGYVAAINAEAVGSAAMLLGAGRRKKEDAVDHGAGLTMLKKVGDYVKSGEPICILHTNLTAYKVAGEMIKQAYAFSPGMPPPITIVFDLVQERLRACIYIHTRPG